MTNYELLQALGFETWLALFEFLKQRGYDHQQHVQLMPATPSLPMNGSNDGDKQPISVDIVAVKALAFEEIHKELPLQKSRDILQELVAESELGAGDKSLFINFLNKLPTRTV